MGRTREGDEPPASLPLSPLLYPPFPLAFISSSAPFSLSLSLSLPPSLSTACPYLSHLHRMPYLHTYELKRKGICVRERKRGGEARYAGRRWLMKRNEKEPFQEETATAPPPSLSLSLSPSLFQFSSRPFRSHLRELLSRPPLTQNI